MTARLTLRILTPAELLLEASDLIWIQVQLIDGSLGILPGHAPLLAETVSGDLRYAGEEGERCMSLKAGILQVQEDSVTVFTGSAAGQEVSELLDHEEAVTFLRLTEMLLKAMPNGRQGR